MTNVCYNPLFEWSFRMNPVNFILKITLTDYLNILIPVTLCKELASQHGCSTSPNISLSFLCKVMECRLHIEIVSHFQRAAGYYELAVLTAPSNSTTL